jgi:hypothetical protein
MSCRAARDTLKESESRHDPTINFTADGADTFDTDAMKITGKWWVCGGRMGFTSVAIRTGPRRRLA